MNLIYIKTFLEIAATRSFAQAAKNLNIAQSTASARINTLEESLGHSLFDRSRAGFEITSAGMNFQKYALNMMRSWEQARQSVGLTDANQSLYRICVQMNLWERLISHWIPWIREIDPEAILDLESDYSGIMMNQLSEGLLDIGVMYTPAKIQGLKIEKLLEEELVMVSTHTQKLSEVKHESYVLVKWGRAFMHMHGQALAGLNTPNISVGLGPIALTHILAEGGSCYQDLESVRPLVTRNELHVVKDAPVFPRPVYMVYSNDADEISRLQLALDGLRHVARIK